MIDKNEVIKLSKLSKLNFNDLEIEEIQKDLNDIFLYMQNLDELNLDEIDPLYNVLEIKGRVYEDVVKEEIKKEDFINNSPKHSDDFISLPIVVGDGNE